MLPELVEKYTDYKRLFNESPVPMWLYNDVTGEIFLSNEAAAQHYGYSETEFLNLRIQDLKVSFNTRQIPAIRISSFNNFYDSTKRLHKKKNGETFYVQLFSYSAIYQGDTARVMLAFNIDEFLTTQEENKKLEELVVTQRKHFDNLLTSVHEAVWVANADTYKINYINAASNHVYGYLPEELINNKNGLLDILMQDDISVFEKAWDVAVTEGKSVFESRIRLKNNNIRYLITHLNYTPAEDNEQARIQGCAMDITRLKASDQKLRQKEASLKSLLESITDGFFMLDEKWNYTYINREFERIIQRRREDLIGKNIWENFPYAEQLRFFNEQRKAMTEQVHIRFEEYLPMLRRWFLINIYPKKGGLSVYMRDVTNEKKQAIKIQVQQDKLKEIAWMQSHKVRSPLATILGLLDLYNTEQPADPMNKELMENIKIAANSLDEIIKDITEKTELVD